MFRQIFILIVLGTFSAFSVCAEEVKKFHFRYYTEECTKGRCTEKEIKTESLSIKLDEENKQLSSGQNTLNFKVDKTSYIFNLGVLEVSENGIKSYRHHASILASDVKGKNFSESMLISKTYPLGSKLILVLPGSKPFEKKKFSLEAL